VRQGAGRGTGTVSGEIMKEKLNLIEEGENEHEKN